MELPEHYHIDKKNLPELIQLLQRIMIGKPKEGSSICVDLEEFVEDK